MDLSADSITILADNWDILVQNVVTITGIDELFADGNQELILITGDPTSVSPFYDAIGADDVSNPTLTNEDDDVAQIVFNLSDNVCLKWNNFNTQCKFNSAQIQMYFFKFYCCRYYRTDNQFFRIYKR